MRWRSRMWALLLLLLAVAWFAAGSSGLLPQERKVPDDAAARQQQQKKEQELFAVEVVRVRHEPWQPRLVFSAHVEPLQQLQVRARVSGEVVETPVREGTRVKRGAVLCRLDETSERAELAAAKAALVSAERDARAAQRLFARGTLPDAQLKQAQARLEQARAAVQRAELALAWRTIRAPVDATLYRQVAKVGDVLSPGAPCATLVVLHPLKVVADAAEPEVGRLKVGMAATARVSSGQELSGRLAYIAPMANVATRTFRIEAEMPNPEREVRAGMTARLVVPLPAQPVVRLPLSALLLADDGRLGVRIVGQDERVAFRPVRIVQEGRQAVMVAGLDDGARVIVSGQHFVKAGQKVRAVVRAGSAAGGRQTPVEQRP